MIDRFHVLPGGRDRELYQETLEDIVADAPADWRTIAMGFRGGSSSGFTLVQRRIVPRDEEPVERARRRGRWLNLGTSIHEMLHAVTHRDFSTAIRALERGDLGVEGFTELFTRRIYADLVDRADGDAELRARIEGAEGDPFTPPPRTSYESFHATVLDILHILGDDAANLEQAYFRGRVEYLGLGRWNALTGPSPGLLGFGVLLHTDDGTLDPERPRVRLDYGHVVWGTRGSVDLDLRLGGTMSYVDEGQRIGAGPTASLTLRGGALYATGTAGVEGNLAASDGSDLQLDAILRVEAGVRLGRFRAGPAVEVLIPISDRDAAERATRVFTGVSLSFEVGR